jgi:uncharacterized membrane protein (UPF0182 family)
MDGRRARISRDANGSNPANRNNLIGWIAGRSDGENYGKTVVYDLPRTKLVDGPLLEALKQTLEALNRRR